MADLPPKTYPPPERQQKTIKNRRLYYIQQNPSYFDNSSHAEADPLSYDRLVRRFQTAQERQIESDKKGWASRMYQDLMLAEERLQKEEDLRAEQMRRAEAGEESDSPSIPEQVDDVTTKEEGEKQWRYLLTLRFLEGLDSDFDYDEVDYNEQWDDLVQLSRDVQDEYFDAEDIQWYTEDGPVSSEAVVATGLKGQTGIQDF